MPQDEEPFARKVAKSRKNILQLQGAVAEKRRDVYALKAAHLKNKNFYYSNKRLGNWRNEYESKKAVDSSYRPSDQRASLRNYGRMDNDLWDRMELRGWFDKYYTPQGLDHIDYEQTRYLTRPVSMPQRYQAITPEPTPSRSYTPVPPSPHWLNHEGNSATQKVRSQMLARGVPYVNHGMDPPWKERPAEEERDGFTKLIPQSEIARVQNIGIGRATQHAHDSAHLVQERTLRMTEGAGLFK
jgi:hypothetical protein